MYYPIVFILYSRAHRDKLPSGWDTYSSSGESLEGLQLQVTDRYHDTKINQVCRSCDTQNIKCGRLQEQG